MLELLILAAVLVMALALLPRRSRPSFSYLEIRARARQVSRRYGA